MPQPSATCSSSSQPREPIASCLYVAVAAQQEGDVGAHVLFVGEREAGGRRQGVDGSVAQLPELLGGDGEIELALVDVAARDGGGDVDFLFLHDIATRALRVLI